jgi:hypothetical protein
MVSFRLGGNFGYLDKTLGDEVRFAGGGVYDRHLSPLVLLGERQVSLWRIRER